MIKTTRQQILDLLSARQIATATEICQILHVTHANARYHLNQLVTEGLVQITGIAKRTQKGRPARQFRLSSRLKEHNLDRLASSLLYRVTSELNPGEVKSFLRETAKDMAGSQAYPDSVQSLGNRLHECVNLLNQLHYKSRWEAHTAAPRLIFEHCPYRQIIDSHPELCAMDAALIEHLTGTKVVQAEKLAPTSQGLVVCVFLVQKPVVSS